MDGIHIVSIRPGALFDRSAEDFPTRLFGWCEDSGPLLLSKSSGSFFGYVASGRAKVSADGHEYQLTCGQYFCVPASVRVENGTGIVIERSFYRAIPMVGGPIEATGRLKYIDGCTDTLLVPPVRRGDACLNVLFFPPAINQTLHTHPSDRLGLVASGKGECRTNSEVLPLTPGNTFLIEKDSIHAFRTNAVTGMTIIAYHPDSDFGPVDDDHPMINRTFVHGISASTISEIRTR